MSTSNDVDGRRFVHGVLSPLIAVASSPEADAIAQENGIPSMSLLLGPFGVKDVKSRGGQPHATQRQTRLTGHAVNVRDAAGHASSFTGFGVRFAPLSDLVGPSLDSIRHALVASVTSEASNHFIKYRNYICKYNGASEHEAFNHPVACMVVGSTASSDPVAELVRLGSLPATDLKNSFMDPQISLKYYVVLHDKTASPNIDTEVLLTQMKKQFGLSCRLIEVNSRKMESDVEFDVAGVWQEYLAEWLPLLDSGANDRFEEVFHETSSSNLGKSSGNLTTTEMEEADSVLSVSESTVLSKPGQIFQASHRTSSYGSFFTEKDVTAFEILVKEFVVQFLLPSMERSVQHWNEQVASRRFLGTTAPSPAKSPVGSLPNDELQTAYPHTSAEQVLRKLADYSFMLRDYKFAYSIYDSIKKDFQGQEKGIKHFAGVQEMIALCVLMSDSGLRGNIEALADSAMTNYRSEKMNIYAMRSILLICEILKSKESYKDASALYLRMDSDLRSAVLLEQSGLCHSKISPPAMKKNAFFMTMAAGRFSKCGQTIAKQKSIHELENLPQPPFPVFNHQSVTVSLVQTLHVGQLMADDAVWDKMEADLVENGYNSMTLTQTKSSRRPVRIMKGVRDGGNTVCAVGEPVFVTFEIRNPLHVNLDLSDVTLTASFVESRQKRANNMTPSVEISDSRLCHQFFDVEYVPSLTIEANETRQVQLKVFPKFEGELKIEGLKAILQNAIPLSVNFEKRGRRLNDTQAQRGGKPVYAVDNTLNLTVTSPMPVLDVLFHNFPSILLNGQVEKFVVEINNKGHRGLKNMKVKISHPSFFEIGSPDQIDAGSYEIAVRDSFTSQESISISNKIIDGSIQDIPLPSTVLAPGTTTLVPFWIRGDKTGKHIFRFLFGYQSSDENDKIGYRKLQYSTSCQVYPSLKINAFTRPSASSLSEFVLGVEIENMQGVDLKLRQISSLSPGWKAEEELMEVKGKQTTFAYFKFAQADHKQPLSPSPESTTTEAVVSYIIGENLPLSPAAMTLRVSNISMDSHRVQCNSFPFSAFSRESRTSWKSQNLQSSYPSIPAAHLPDLFTLYLSDDADIVLFWEAPPLQSGGPVRMGHHFIIGINLGLQAPLQLLARIGKNASNLTFATRSMYAATAAERKTLVDSLVKTRVKDVSPLRLVLRKEAWFESSTSGNRDHILNEWIIELKAHLRNTSWRNRVSYVLELPSNESNTSIENDFTWIRQTVFEGELDEEQGITVSLFACFGRRGTFDVNRWRLTVRVLSRDGEEGGNGAGSSGDLTGKIERNFWAIIAASPHSQTTAKLSATMETTSVASATRQRQYNAGRGLRTVADLFAADDSAFSGHLSILIPSRGWERRFFVLAGTSMSMFASANHSEMVIDEFPMSHSSGVVTTSLHTFADVMAFEIVENGSLWILAAGTQHAKDAWIMAIRLFISRISAPAPFERQFVRRARTVDGVPRRPIPTRNAESLNTQQLDMNWSQWQEPTYDFINTDPYEHGPYTSVQSKYESISLSSTSDDSHPEQAISSSQSGRYPLNGYAMTPNSHSQGSQESKRAGIQGGGIFGGADVDSITDKKKVNPKERKTDFASWLKELY
ncbi:Trafficking protein particle complex 8 [Entophlyctis luteolus]|nr:Trafficking protein particle complex 8 [Entophlyctis luteolus]